MKIILYEDSMRIIMNPSMCSLEWKSKSKVLDSVSDTLKIMKLAIIQWQLWALTT